MRPSSKSPVLPRATWSSGYNNRHQPRRLTPAAGGTKEVPVNASRSLGNRKYAPHAYAKAVARATSWW
eukprot:3367522-Lingulodinium_polyedra.AAC.1